MADAALLVAHLREPTRLIEADSATWNALIRLGRAEALIGTLGAVAREAGVWELLPERARIILDDAAIRVAHSQRSACWEAHQAMRALRGIDGKVVLLKGTAYVAAGLPAASGRHVGDLDILLPRASLDAAEVSLRAAGWAPLKTNPYDDAYYRRWMHELPPLVHGERGTVIDVHHTILPLTARLHPDADALLADAVPVKGGHHVLSPPDMLLHSIAHLFYDGDFEGGLRNLWDIHRLIGHFAMQPGFWAQLADRARLHQLEVPLARALRFSHKLYGTAIDPMLAGRPEPLDILIRRRLLGRTEWGHAAGSTIAARLLYMRSHWLRMPPGLLARHLLTKWRMRHGL